jgi:hypothetical protein
MGITYKFPYKESPYMIFFPFVFPCVSVTYAQAPVEPITTILH